MIRLMQYGTELPYKTLTFSGGERHVELPPIVGGLAAVRADLFTSDDVMDLLLVTDALKRAGVPADRLVCPYLPYARQDRVMRPGQPLSLRVVCDLVNRLGYPEVEVWDAHSDVSLACLNRVVNLPPEEFIGDIPADILNDCLLVAPDAGAAKKVAKVAQAFNRPLIQAGKHRDTADGAITGTYVQDGGGLAGADVLIVDDICDGGRTFIELAKVLREKGAKAVYLYVTHGIFSQGLRVFDGCVDHVYTANAFPKADRKDPALTVLR